MKFLKNHVNRFQMIVILSLCLISVVKMNGMESLPLTIKYTYNPSSSGTPFEKNVHLSFSQGISTIISSALRLIITDHLIPSQRQKILILRGYNKGTEEVVLSSKENRLISIQELKEMDYLRVVIFDTQNK